MSEKSKLDTKEPTQLKQINLNEIIKPLWIKLSRKNFLSLVKDVVNNLDNKNYQTMISNNRYDLTNVEQFLLEIITKKINKNEACKLYKKLIEQKAIELTRAKSSRGKNKRWYILNIYNNVKSSIFEGVYFHYFNEPIIKESMADRVKLRTQRLDIIDKNKKKKNNQLFTEYFNYSNPNTMIRILKDAGDEKNKNMVESVKKKLNKMKKIIKNAPEDEEYKKIIDIV